MDNVFREIKNGNLSGVKRAAEAGTLLSEYSAAGLTPLGAAILHKRADIVKYLLEAGADIQLGYKSESCQDKDKLRPNWPEVSPPIHCAAASGAADLVRILVDHGADVNDPSGLDYGAEILSLFAATGHATQALIELGADVSRMNAVRFTPLVHAIAREDVHSARLLVEHGADVEIERMAKYRIRIASSGDAKDSGEQVVQGTSSPLMVAGHQGRLRHTSAQMIEILAAGGADVNRRYLIKSAAGDVSFTLLSLICCSRVPIPKLKGQYAKDLLYGEKEVATIRALIAAGADVTDPPVLGYICEGEMPFSDFRPRLEVLKLLIQHGVLANSSAGIAAQTALLKSFRKEAEAELQFQDMAQALAEAGAYWDVPEDLDQAVMPKYLNRRLHNGSS
ncbi:hypothetical protein TruAng_005031 [Truncatella angustata]|nr:hypothetical protein TruAng_005031 [Truncatella angustata]